MLAIVPSFSSFCSRPGPSPAPEQMIDLLSRVARPLAIRIESIGLDLCLLEECLCWVYGCFDKIHN